MSVCAHKWFVCAHNINFFCIPNVSFLICFSVWNNSPPVKGTEAPALKKGLMPVLMVDQTVRNCFDGDKRRYCNRIWFCSVGCTSVHAEQAITNGLDRCE